MNELLTNTVEMMDNSAPIGLNDINFDFRNPPVVVASAMEDIWYYDAVTELRTGGSAGFAATVRRLVPSAHDPKSDLGMYLPRWLRHELPHGAIALEALKRVGIETPLVLPDKLPAAVQFLGEIATHFPWFEAINEGVIATQATRNEKMTLDHYRIERHKLIQMGEVDFAETGVRKMIEQEALHLAWNRHKLTQIVRERSTAQLHAIAAFDKQLWQPVGAKSKLFRNDLIRSGRQLADGHEGEILSMVGHVQNVVDDILATRLPSRHAQSFVLKRVLAAIPNLEEVR